MINEVLIRYNQTLETWKTSGFSSIIHKTFFLAKEMVLVERDLSCIEAIESPVERKDIKFIEITKNDIMERHLSHPVKSRSLKIKRNLTHGFEGFGITKDKEMIGDIWHFRLDSSKGKKGHPDLKWFKGDLDERGVYMFDMYIKPEERGRGSVNFLLLNSFKALKNKGFLKVYGYYMADNIPALWVHRMMGYKELGRLRLHRFFFLNGSVEKN